jgi:hypothetical protein
VAAGATLRLVALAAALTVAGAPGCGAAGGGRVARVGSHGQVALGGCHMTLDVFAADRAGIRALVPSRYRLGSYAGEGRATLAFWVISCDSSRIGSERARPLVLSLVGAQVRSPVNPVAPVAPATFDHYLLFAHSSDKALVERLRGVGLPADWVPGMRFHRGRVAVASVPWSRGPYVVRVRGNGYEQPHDHDNSYWHDGPGGTSRLEVRFYRATDRGCSDCSDAGVFTSSRSPIARLLGASSFTRPYVAFDHNRIASGDVAVFAPRRFPFRVPRPAGFLGVEGVTIDDSLVQKTKHTGTPVPAVAGVLVTTVLPGEPAAIAGVRGGHLTPVSPGPGLGVDESIGGDVILAVNGASVHTIPALVALIAGMRPGTQAKITILRNGAHKTIVATLAEQPRTR